LKIFKKLRTQAMKRMNAASQTSSNIAASEHAYLWSMLLTRYGELENAIFDVNFVIQCTGSENAVCYAFLDNETSIEELEDVSCQATMVSLYTWNPLFYAKRAPANVTVHHIRKLFH
jgi:hypothetical protein